MPRPARARTPGRLGHFKLMRVAGAYWRGDEKQPDAPAHLRHGVGVARRTSTPTSHRLEEAEKRDHRKLGAELDLFSFPDEIGSGLAVFHPKGGIVRRLMEDYSPPAPRGGRLRVRLLAAHHQGEPVRDLRPPRLVRRRHVPAHALDDETASGDYYLKPMNCPFHILIYQSRLRSYRELPLRLFEFGTVYRYEKSGVVHGLTRVPGLHAGRRPHLLHQGADARGARSRCSTSCSTCCATTASTTSTSSCRPSPRRRRSAPIEEWDEATEVLRQVARSKDLELVMDPGGGAFYGPKISVQARDAIGRTWQMSTIQLDFQTPQRFGIEYVGADGARHAPVMIHRALFGSVERFFAILLEHYAGAFPTWLAPVQVRVLPVSATTTTPTPMRLADRLRAEGFRADVVDADEKLGNRIRKAKIEKLPYVLVVGDDDVEHGTVGVNPRGGEVERGRPGRRLRRPARGPRSTPPPRPTVSLDRLWAGLADHLHPGGQRGPRRVVRPDERAGRCSSASSRAGCPTRRPTSSGGARGCAALLNAYPYGSGHLMVLPQPGGGRARGPRPGRGRRAVARRAPRGRGR